MRGIPPNIDQPRRNLDQTMTKLQKTPKKKWTRHRQNVADSCINLFGPDNFNVNFVFNGWECVYFKLFGNFKASSLSTFNINQETIGYWSGAACSVGIRRHANIVYFIGGPVVSRIWLRVKNPGGNLWGANQKIRRQCESSDFSNPWMRHIWSDRAVAEA